jgi:hypothetical protein
MHRGSGDFIVSNDFVFGVNVGVVLVTEKTLLPFLGVASVGVFLTTLGF